MEAALSRTPAFLDGNRGKGDVFGDFPVEAVTANG